MLSDFEINVQTAVTLYHCYNTLFHLLCNKQFWFLKKEINKKSLVSKTASDVKARINALIFNAKIFLNDLLQYNFFFQNSIGQ